MLRTSQHSFSSSSPATTTTTTSISSCFYPRESLGSIESKPVPSSPTRQQQQQQQEEEDNVQKTRQTPTAHTTRTSWTKLTVTGYTIRDTEKRVMYHVDVHSVTTCITKGSSSQPEEETFAPIDQVYTIRRSYSDFKALHDELSSLVSLHRKEQGRSSSVVSSPEVPSVSTALPDPKSFKTCTSTPDQSGNSKLPLLPSLPSAGFLSYWKRHDRSHLQSRCEIFQEILDLVLQYDFFKDSFGLQNFLSIAPSAFRPRGSSYVSLCEYSIPQADLKLNATPPEIQKKKILERRRNSSAHPPYARLGSNGLLILPPQGNQQPIGQPQPVPSAFSSYASSPSQQIRPRQGSIYRYERRPSFASSSSCPSLISHPRKMYAFVSKQS